MVIALTEAPFISIGSIRGRIRGGGNGLALAVDLRYASVEKAIIGQPELGTAVVPGGGATERLPVLIGSDRALEVLLTSADYDATKAERWGWVTRALPDDELDSYIMCVAERLASLDRNAFRLAKSMVNRVPRQPHGRRRIQVGKGGVDRAHGAGAFADRSHHTLHKTPPHLDDGEDGWDARLESERRGHVIAAA